MKKFLMIVLISNISLSAQVPSREQGRYLNDYAGLFTQSESSVLNQELANYEKRDSITLLIVTIPRISDYSIMPSGSPGTETRFDDLRTLFARWIRAWDIGSSNRRVILCLIAVEDQVQILQPSQTLYHLISQEEAKKICPRIGERDTYQAAVNNLVTSVMKHTRKRAATLEKERVKREFEKNLREIKEKRESQKKWFIVKLIGAGVVLFVILTIIFKLVHSRYLWSIRKKKAQEDLTKKAKTIADLRTQMNEWSIEGLPPWATLEFQKIRDEVIKQSDETEVFVKDLQKWVKKQIFKRDAMYDFTHKWNRLSQKESSIRTSMGKFAELKEESMMYQRNAKPMVDEVIQILKEATHEAREDLKNYPTAVRQILHRLGNIKEQMSIALELNEKDGNSYRSVFLEAKAIKDEIKKLVQEKQENIKESQRLSRLATEFWDELNDYQANEDLLEKRSKTVKKSQRDDFNDNLEQYKEVLNQSFGLIEEIKRYLGTEEFEITQKRAINIAELLKTCLKSLKELTKKMK
ncbi:TPM domain-containing protein [Patescibacteria group bacterium]|nr:TPM domain-containing protein [Patescibacteria group bacterium]